MSDETTEAGAGAGREERGAEPPRTHPQDPAEGADDGGADETRKHAQDPAEGADDESATS